MTDFMLSIYIKERGVDLKQNPEAHHKHLHEADLALCCLTTSVAASQSGRTQTNQKLSFENCNNTALLIKFYFMVDSIKCFFKSIHIYSSNIIIFYLTGQKH